MTICCDRGDFGFGRAARLICSRRLAYAATRALRAALSDHAPLIIDYDYVL